MSNRVGIKPSPIASVFAAIVGIGMLFVVVPLFLGTSGRTSTPPPQVFSQRTDEGTNMRFNESGSVSLAEAEAQHEQARMAALSQSNPAQVNPVSGFLVLWVVVLVGIVLYHIANALGAAPALQTIEVTPSDKRPPSETLSVNLAPQLRELEHLRTENLISQTEYEEKRLQVLDMIGKSKINL